MFVTSEQLSVTAHAQESQPAEDTCLMLHLHGMLAHVQHHPQPSGCNCPSEFGAHDLGSLNSSCNQYPGAQRSAAGNLGTGIAL